MIGLRRAEAQALACGGLVTSPEAWTVLGVHPGGLTRLVTDGSSVVSGGWDGAVRRWPGATLREADGDAILALAAEGSDVVFATSQSVVRGSAVLRPPFDEMVTAVAVRGPLVFVTADVHRVALLREGEVAWAGRTYKWAYGAAFSPDGREVAAWTWDGQLCRWDVATGSVLDPEWERQPPYPGGPIFGGAWLDDRRIVLVGSHTPGGFAVIWDVVDARVTAELAMDVQVNAVAVDRSGAVWLGDDHGSVWWWEPGSPAVPLVGLAGALPPVGDYVGQFPPTADFTVCAGPHSVVALAPHAGGVAVGTCGGHLVWVRSEPGTVSEARAAGRSWAEGPAAPVPDWRGAALVARTGVAHGIGYRVEVPETWIELPCDTGSLFGSRDLSVTLTIGARPGVDLASEVAGVRSLAQLTGVAPLREEATPGGHRFVEPFGCTRLVVVGDAVLRCWAVDRSETPGDGERLAGICATLLAR